MCAVLPEVAKIEAKFSAWNALSKSLTENVFETE